MKLKTLFRVTLVLLTASFATAQIPCGPTIIPKATLFVNWAQFQYDAGHSGCNPYESILNPNTVGALNVKWQAGGPVAFSSSVVADGLLYVSWDTSMGNSGVFAALNANTGTLIWEKITQNYSFSTAAVANGIVYAGSSDTNVYAWDAKTGGLLWQYPTANQVTSAPAVANGIVYVGSGQLYALNAVTGALIWSSPNGSLLSPAVAAAVVYVGSGGLYALNATTGDVIWEYAPPAYVRSTPVVANGRVYVNAYDGNLYAVNAASGALIWQYPISSSTPPAVDKSMAYVPGDDGNVYALNAATGALQWTYETHDDQESLLTASVANGLVYVSSDHYLTILNASTGAQLWLAATGFATSSPTVTNGIVYVGTQPFPPVQVDGYLYAFSLHGH